MVVELADRGGDRGVATVVDGEGGDDRAGVGGHLQHRVVVHLLGYEHTFDSTPVTWGCQPIRADLDPTRTPHQPRRTT